VKEEKFNAISVLIVDIIFHPLGDQKGSWKNSLRSIFKANKL